MDYRGLFEDAVDTLRAEKRYRVFADLERVAGQFPRAIYRDDADNMRDITIWCSNDYLGMGQHPKVIGAMQDTAARLGVGSGGTRNISGTNRPLVELERSLADLHRKEAALVFTSGFVSNEAAISTIARLLPDCQLMAVGGAGHMGPITHAPEVSGLMVQHIEQAATDAADRGLAGALVGALGSGCHACSYRAQAEPCAASAPWRTDDVSIAMRSRPCP